MGQDDNQHTKHKFIDINCTSAVSNDFEQNNISLNKYTGTPPTPVSFSGPGASTASFLRAIGGTNFIDLLGSSSISGRDYAGNSSSENRVYTSRQFLADETVNQLAWQIGAELSIGGTIVKVEIVETVGTLTGCRLRVGNTSVSSAVLDIADISAVVYTNGTYNTNSTGVVFSDATNNTITVTAGAGTGSFRVRITYRAT